MTSASIAPVPAPADIGTRIVHLIDGIHGLDDLSADRVTQLTGIPLGFDPQDANRYGFGGMLDDHWACHLASIPNRKGGPPKRMVFSYDDIRQDSGSAIPASAPEFEDFARALRDAGYAQSVISGTRGAVWGHRFTRNGVNVDVQTEREDPQAADIRFRVSRLTIDATEVGTEVGHG